MRFMQFCAKDCHSLEFSKLEKVSRNSEHAFVTHTNIDFGLINLFGPNPSFPCLSAWLYGAERKRERLKLILHISPAFCSW